MTPGEPVDHHHKGSRAQAEHRDQPHQPVDLPLERGPLGFDGLEGRADPAELGAGAGRLHEREPVTLDHERAGEHPRSPIAARPAHRSGSRLGLHGCLLHGHGLAGECGLVHREVHGIQQHGVRGHPVALGEQGMVPADHVAAGDPHLYPVTYDERAGRGEVAQRRQRILGLVLLVNGDRDDDHDKGHQHRAVEWLGKHEVDRPGSEQKQKDRLPDDLPGLLQQIPLLLGGQLVGAVLGQAPCRLHAGQAGQQGHVLNGLHQPPSAAPSCPLSAHAEPRRTPTVRYHGNDEEPWHPPRGTPS